MLTDCLFRSTLVAAALLVGGLAPGVHAGPSDALVGDLIAADGGSARLHLTDAEVDALLQSDDEVSWSDAGLDGAAPRRWWAPLASAVVPGLGEVLTRRWHGAALIAADAFVWSQWFDKNSEGSDLEDEYRAFITEKGHWNEAQWQAAINGTGAAAQAYEAWRNELGGYGDYENVPLWVTREEDEREWFENAGKWDIFAFGWREFWDGEYQQNQADEVTLGQLYRPQPGDPNTWYFDQSPYLTPLRREYQELRIASNDAFATRDNYTYAALLTRVFSTLYMAYVEGFIGGRYDDASESSGLTSRGLVAHSQGIDGGGIGWKVTY